MSKQLLSLKIGILASSLFFIPIARGSDFAVPNPANYQIASSQCPSVQRSNNAYTVRLGDTLSGIGRRHGLNLNQVLCLNPNLRGNPNLILVGQKINVGRGTPVNVVSQNTSPRNTWQPRRVFLPKPVTPVAPQNRSARVPQSTPATSSSMEVRPSAWNFNLPDRVRRGSNRMGATRGGPACYVEKNDRARSLIPKTNFGYTFKDYPTFFWYQPELLVPSVPVEFKLLTPREDNPKLWDRVYQTEFTNTEAGIVSFTLPTDAAPLEEGKEYKWQIKIGCKLNVFTIFSSNVERLSTNNSQLESMLANSSIEDYPKIYAQQGIWYDILPIMTALLQKNYNDSLILENWSEILKEIGYEDLSQLPSINKN